MQFNRYLLLFILFLNQIILAGFDTNTLVQTPNGRELIGRLKHDDLVMCRKGDQLQEGRVRNQNVKREQIFWRIELDNETIRASANQRFYAIKSKQWKKVQDLVPGERLLTLNNEEVLVQRAYEVDEKIELNEIEVDNCHNYFASQTGVLVHNEPFTIGIGISIALGAGAAEAVCVTGSVMIAGIIGMKIASDSNSKRSFEADLNIEKINEELLADKSRKPAKEKSKKSGKAAKKIDSEKDKKSDKDDGEKNPKKDDEETVIPLVASGSEKDEKSASSRTVTKDAAPQQASSSKYADAPYHHTNSKGGKSPAPKDGQKALDNSVLVKEKGNTGYQRRVAAVDNQFIVLDQTGKDEFHGHTRPWNEMTREMKEKLIESGAVSKKGKIL